MIQQSLDSRKLSILDGGLVGSLIKKGIELSNISDLDLSNPTIFLGALVDSLSLVFEDIVTSNDLTGDRREDIGSRLDGLDSTDGLTGSNLETFLGKLDVDDITQGVGSVVGDTDLG
jgi:hypothetical protein